MTQAQADAYVCGVEPEHNDPRFVAQHLAAYTFTRQFARGKRVLEIGFGEGFGANYLAEEAGEVVGVDLAPGNIPRAQAKYRRPNLRFFRMEGTKLDFPDGSFDVVGSFQVIEHIPEPQLPTYLAEIRRVLRENGVAVISTLNLDHNMKPGTTYQKLCYHEKEFTGPELRALLKRFFPYVELHGLYLTWEHQVMLRLKRWGLNTIGPPRLNPVARYYDRITVNDFRTKPVATRQALDLLALCRKTP